MTTPILDIISSVIVPSILLIVIVVISVALYILYCDMIDSKKIRTNVDKYCEKAPCREKSTMTAFGYLLLIKIRVHPQKINESYFHTDSRFVTTLINCKHHEYYDLVVQEIYRINLPRYRSVLVTILSYMKKYSKHTCYNHDNLFFVVDGKIILGIINYPPRSNYPYPQSSYTQSKEFIDTNN